MFYVRFNLENNGYKGWWLVESESGQSWVNPQTHSLILRHCRLTVDRSTANRIYKGEGKRGCAWIACEVVSIIESRTALRILDIAFCGDGAQVIAFNPRVSPHWHIDGVESDNAELDEIVTSGKTVYVHP